MLDQMLKILVLLCCVTGNDAYKFLHLNVIIRRKTLEKVSNVAPSKVQVSHEMSQECPCHVMAIHTYPYPIVLLIK